MHHGRGMGITVLILWRHQMEHFPRYWPFVRGIHRSLVNSPHKGQWRGVLMFSLISTWTNGSVNNRDAGDLRCHRVHYDVIIMDMWYLIFSSIGAKDIWINMKVANTGSPYTLSISNGTILDNDAIQPLFASGDPNEVIDWFSFKKSWQWGIPHINLVMTHRVYFPTGRVCWVAFTFIHQWLPSFQYSWWRHQMDTFSVLLAICAGNSSLTGDFPSQRPVTRSFDIFFDLSMNKRLSKQLWGWWFETPSCSLWRQCNDCWHSLALWQNCADEMRTKLKYDTK